MNVHRVGISYWNFVRSIKVESTREGKGVLYVGEGTKVTGVALDIRRYGYTINDSPRKRNKERTRKSYEGYLGRTKTRTIRCVYTTELIANPTLCFFHRNFRSLVLRSSFLEFHGKNLDAFFLFFSPFFSFYFLLKEIEFFMRDFRLAFRIYLTFFLRHISYIHTTI